MPATPARRKYGSSNVVFGRPATAAVAAPRSRWLRSNDAASDAVDRGQRDPAAGVRAVVQSVELVHGGHRQRGGAVRRYGLCVELEFVGEMHPPVVEAPDQQEDQVEAGRPDTGADHEVDRRSASRRHDCAPGRHPTRSSQAASVAISSASNSANGTRFELDVMIRWILTYALVEYIRSTSDGGSGARAAAAAAATSSTPRQRSPIRETDMTSECPLLSYGFMRIRGEVVVLGDVGEPGMSAVSGASPGTRKDR